MRGWPPADQLIATGISERPITAMIEPVTTGGNSGSARATRGANRMPKRPAAMPAPRMALMPSAGLPAIATIGPTAAKVTPIMIGRRMPKRPTPSAWMMVTRPQHSRSALMRKAIWSLGSLSAPPTISGTAIAPAYITSTCCRARVNRRPPGGHWSTGSSSSGRLVRV